MHFLRGANKENLFNNQKFHKLSVISSTFIAFVFDPVVIQLEEIKYQLLLEDKGLKESQTQDEIARIRKRKRGRNMLNRSGNTTDNLCFRYRFRDVFSRFRCCVYNGTGPLLRKHNGNMELHVSATFQKYWNMWFRPVKAFRWNKIQLRL